MKKQATNNNAETRIILHNAIKMAQSARKEAMQHEQGEAFFALHQLVKKMAEMEGRLIAGLDIDTDALRYDIEAMGCVIDAMALNIYEAQAEAEALKLDATKDGMYYRHTSGDWITAYCSDCMASKEDASDWQAWEYLEGDYQECPCCGAPLA